MTFEEKLKIATERIISCAVFLEHDRAKELQRIPNIEQMEIDDFIQIAFTVSAYVSDIAETGKEIK